ncbi:hypothetical protein [Methylobacterium nodulans]|uniref:Uncharacterized protein n=1 Tax=Methylobacterium nodulans (strain LMG 21967 / CNCM I-2342 / ORS 2060) TaxID=460265 RepID=B8ICN0_METNO|nr:hypothetical protein [Methylobacterium nodulans]ACL57441.1 hypothetical protein Mnod_2471 [Methylobacterium nodulans ORS 2060]
MADLVLGFLKTAALVAFISLAVLHVHLERKSVQLPSKAEATPALSQAAYIPRQ